MEECKNGFDEETRQKLHELVKRLEQKDQDQQKYKERLGALSRSSLRM